MSDELLQAAEALAAAGVERVADIRKLVVDARGPLLRYVDLLGRTWFSHIDAPGALGVRP
jgi:hypothetical protein